MHALNATFGKTFWRGKWRAVHHGLLWTGRRWLVCGAARQIEPLDDCPWYAHPDEATRRARGLPPVRYVGERNT